MVITWFTPAVCGVLLAVTFGVDGVVELAVTVGIDGVVGLAVTVGIDGVVELAVTLGIDGVVGLAVTVDLTGGVRVAGLFVTPSRRSQPEKPTRINKLTITTKNARFMTNSSSCPKEVHSF
jgi:hypothetical protein